MSKIRVLSDHVANQIAAGEVVERPASVAKELVENSIDAGARRIEIDVEAGGRRLLRVSDDGEGMTRDDALLAFERHATSKITSAEDLTRVSTLGFRGEALASIASVARVELLTQIEGEGEGTRVLIEGGRMRDVSPAARPRGTTISVRDLFFNIPARRKFLRSEATESFHLTNLVTHYALSHPEIAFTLTNNGREVLRAAPAASLRERAYQIFGAEFVESLLEVEGGYGGVVRVRGYVSAPRERRTTRDAQYLFVNNRFVRDRLVARGLSEGFRAVLPQGTHPAALLFLEVPPEEVDVNVHPAKTEVRFRRTTAISDAVRDAVRASLAAGGFVRAESPAPESRTDSYVHGYGTASDQNALEADAHASDPQALRPVAHSPDAGEAIIAGNATIESEATIEEAARGRTSEGDAPIEGGANAGKATATDAAREAFLSSTAGWELNAPVSDLREESPQPAMDFGPAPPLEEETAWHSLRDAEGARAEASALGLEERAAGPQGASGAPSSAPPEEAQTQAPPHTSEQGRVRAGAFPPVGSVSSYLREPSPQSLAGEIRTLGQLEDSFIVAADAEGLLLIDQHAAHERILFDKYRALEAERAAESQHLLLPETFDLTPAQAAVFDQAAEELERHGFGLMRLSGRTVAVRAVPADLPPGEARGLLAEILDAVEAERRGRAREGLREVVAIRLAGRAAVKSGTPLTPEKMRWLVARLLRTSSPTTCPRGRPVVLRLDRRDLARAFQKGSRG